MPAGKFTKAEIIDAIYQEMDITRPEVKFVVDSVFDVIKEALIGGRGIELRGFGTFEVRVRKGRKQARNPRTGELVMALPHGIAIFKPGKELKNAVWSLENEDSALKVVHTMPEVPKEDEEVVKIKRSMLKLVK